MQNFNANAASLPMAGYGAYGAPQPMVGGPMVNPAALGMAQVPAGQVGPVMVTPQMSMSGQQRGTLPMAPSAPGAQAMLGAEATKPPSPIGAAMKGALVFGGIGAALGAAASIVLPGGLLVGAALGGVAGALFGAFRGFRNAQRAQEEHQMMMQGAPGMPADPNALGPQVPVHVANANGPGAPIGPKAGTRKRKVTVRSGDTLGAIAKRHDVTVKQLHEANRSVIGPNPSRIKVGVMLVIPAK